MGRPPTTGRRNNRSVLEHDWTYDVWSDVNSAGRLGLTMRRASSTVAMVVKAALEREGWTVQLRGGTPGPRAKDEQLGR